LVLIPWSVNGIHSLRGVPKGTMYNIAFFTDAVMPSLIENTRSRTRRKTLKIVDPHGQCASSQVGASSRACRCLKNRIPAASDLQPRPDPGNFFLFGHVKGKLSDYNCDNWEYPLTVITEFFTRVEQDVLLSVFEFWGNRSK
jgi:hypothetical protein